MTEDKQLKAPEKEPVKVSFSVPQIAGGALAAATAAFLGSRLGVAGTIFGAAVASIVGGVGGTLYTAGIDRTHRRVTDAIQRGYDRVRRGTDYDADAAHPLDADAGETRALGAHDADPFDTVFRTPEGATRVDPVPAAPADQPARGRFWKVTAMSVGAMFLGALIAITAIELGIGRTLDGRDGTTVSQVVKPEAPASRKPTPTPTVTTPAPTPSATSETPTPTPTATTTTPAPTATDATPTPAQSGGAATPSPSA